MSSSAITTQVAQLKIGSVQNQADSSGVYSAGVWSFKNSTALTSVTITDAGNVGIGTASPLFQLHTLTAATGTTIASNVVARFASNGSGRDVAVQFSDSVANSAALGMLSGNMYFITQGTERMRIDAIGALTVGSSGSSMFHTLQAPSNPAGTPAVVVRKQNVAINTSGNTYIECFGSSGGFDGYIGVAGTTFQTNDASDSRKKENVRPANYGLKEIKALNPVVYDWKEEFGGEKDIKGFLAQEVKQVLPECVTTRDETEVGGFEDAHYLGTANMIPVLVAAIQELSAKVDAQAAEIEALKAK